MKIELQSLFAVPLIKFKFTNHNLYNFPEIEKKVSKPKNWVKPLNTSFGFSTDNFFTNSVKNQMVDDLKCDLDHVFSSLRIPTSFDICEIWYNIYHDFQGQEKHDHLPPVGITNPYWCGVYYNKNPSPTIFHCPNNLARISYIPEYSDPKCYLYDYYAPVLCPEVEEGDVILFPPWIEHSIETGDNFKNRMRLTFAFNLALIH